MLSFKQIKNFLSFVREAVNLIPTCPHTYKQTTSTYLFTQSPARPDPQFPKKPQTPIRFDPHFFTQRPFPRIDRYSFKQTVTMESSMIPFDFNAIKKIIMFVLLCLKKIILFVVFCLKRITVFAKLRLETIKLYAESKLR